MDLNSLKEEVFQYVGLIEVGEDGEHVWDNYQRVMAITMRLQDIHNRISMLEILGEAEPELKKFRTLVVDPTIERFDKVAAFESRKISGKQLEWSLEKRD